MRLEGGPRHSQLSPRAALLGPNSWARLLLRLLQRTARLTRRDCSSQAFTLM